jgi:hypothetical protein
MKKYTFILEFKGGTYISQNYEESINSSIKSWVNNLKIEEIQGMTQNKYLILTSKALNADNLAQLQNLNGVWCLCFTLISSFCLITIVE